MSQPFDGKDYMRVLFIYTTIYLIPPCHLREFETNAYYELVHFALSSNTINFREWTMCVCLCCTIILALNT